MLVVFVPRRKSWEFVSFVQGNIAATWLLDSEDGESKGAQEKVKSTKIFWKREEFFNAILNQRLGYKSDEETFQKRERVCTTSA